MAERMRMLLENRWELYDEKKMRKKKILIVGFLLLFVYAMWFFFMYMILRELLASVVCASGILLLFVLIIFLKVRQMDRKKDGWYFSAYQDKRLRREDVLELVGDFLSSGGYAFKKEETHRTMTLWITYFALPTLDFKLRVWFSKVGGLPMVEIGIGPETESNRDLIREFRDGISREFIKRYGSKNLENDALHTQKETPGTAYVHGKDPSVKNEDYETPYRVK